MTNQTEPIRKSSLPTTPPPEWEFHTVTGARTGTDGCALFPGDTGPVVVRRLVTYGDWEPVRPDRWADEPESAAVSAAVAPPTERAAAPVCRDEEGCHRVVPCAPGCGTRDLLAEATRPMPAPADWDDLVREADRLRRDGAALHARAEELDTQLAALRQQVTEPTDRAAVLRDFVRQLTHRLADCCTECDACAVIARDLADAELRRMADETATQTPSMRLARQSVQAMTDTLQQACPPGCVACATDESHDPEPAAGARQDGAET
ncbi:hypothetical protein ACWDPF_27660 [Streptomyces albogriseolus]